MATAVSQIQPPDPQYQAAFDRFRRSVIPSDAVSFQNTTLEDVWKEASEIQESHRKKQISQNIGRLEPFLRGIEKYAKTLEVICNGTPYIPWIWAPIKLMLQLASEFSNVFEKLLGAYAQIAENMPHFDRLRGRLSDDENFRSVLAMVYTDILEFHRRAYKFFKRRKWHMFFDALWKDFEFRFNSIIERLARHKQLLMDAAITIDITEARSWRGQEKKWQQKEQEWRIQELEWRRKQSENLIKSEKDRHHVQRRDCMNWFQVKEDQESVLDLLSQKKQSETGKWIRDNAQLLSWIDHGNFEPILWLKGIPGAGKSVLCTSIVEFLKEKQGITTAYYLCNSYTNGGDVPVRVLRSIAQQILQDNLDLVPFIFDNYANCGLLPSIPNIRKLLAELVVSHTIRICIDGLDECQEKDQKPIVREIVLLSKLPGSHCRVLFSNRDSPQINQLMPQKRTISLMEESINVNKDIMIYVDEKLSALPSRENFPDELIEKVKCKIVEKAQGMFLWVRLVLMNLDDCDSIRELEDAVERLPDGLDEAYGRILDRIKELRPVAHQKAMRMLQWMACSFRTLKLYELHDGIVIQPGNLVLDETTKIDGIAVLDLCKPMIEGACGNKVDFVHYSAKEYILHLASGPFLVGTEAHYQIAFSCISYLSTSSCFFNASISEEMLKIRVLKRYHGLHHYANNFWFEHLLEAARSPIASNANILDPTKQLLSFWKEGPSLDYDENLSDEEAAKDGLADRLAVLKDFPEIKWMVHEMLVFRAFLDKELDPSKTPEELKALELKHDPTHFGIVSKRYQEMVQSLINSSEDDRPATISIQEYQKFKAAFSDSAFLCRSIECAHSVDGFRTESERNSHETSKHLTLLRCADSTCLFYANGFTSRRSLAKHKRRYHPEPAMTLPEFGIPVPTTEDEDPGSESPAPTGPQVRYTPVRNRVSKAKKGLPVHICEICQKVCTRAENLRRHLDTHQKPMYPCTSGCEKAFYRPDQLARHLKSHINKANRPQKRRRVGSPSTSTLTSESATPNYSSQESMPEASARPVNPAVQSLKHTDSRNTNASASSSSQTLNSDMSASTSVSENETDAEMS